MTRMPRRSASSAQPSRSRGASLLASPLPRAMSSNARGAGRAEIDRIGRDDEHVLAIADVTQQQRQGSLAGAAEADDDDAPAEADVLRVALDVHLVPGRSNLRSRGPGRPAATSRRE